MTRNLKSIYYDKYTGQIDKATKHQFYPCKRPHRYLFLFKSFSNITNVTARIIDILKENNINHASKKQEVSKPRRFKTKEFQDIQPEAKDLPF